MRLVALLNQYNVTLIEDDVYSELYFGQEKPLPAKAWDRHDGVCIALRFRNVWCLVFVLVGSPPENMHVKFNACS